MVNSSGVNFQFFQHFISKCLKKINAIPLIQIENSETHLFRLDKKKQKNTLLFAFSYKQFFESLFFLKDYSDL